MEPKKLSTIGLLQALGVLVYVGLVAALMHFLSRFFPNQPNILGMILMLLLLVVSAAVTGSIVFGYSGYLALNRKTKEALTLFAYTILYCLAFTIVITVILAVL